MNGRTPQLINWAAIVTIAAGLVAIGIEIGELRAQLLEVLENLEGEEPRPEVSPVAPTEPPSPVVGEQKTFSNSAGWGSWSEAVFCEPGQYVCGFQQRVEPSQGRGDDTAMNAMAFYCCDDQ